MIIAYIRVSTERQDLENQKKEILRYASKKQIKINRWIKEVVSGSVSKKERLLDGTISCMSQGDTIIVTEISRISRSLLEILTIIEDCVKRGIIVHSVKEGYTLDNSINSKVLIFTFGLVAEIERSLISIRTKEALASRKAEGKHLGRPFGSNSKQNILIFQKDNIVKMMNNKVSILQICKIYGVSRTTFDRFRAKHM